MAWNRQREQAVRLRFSDERRNPRLGRRLAWSLTAGVAALAIALSSGTLSGFELPSPRWVEPAADPAHSEGLSLPLSLPAPGTGTAGAGPTAPLALPLPPERPDSLAEEPVTAQPAAEGAVSGETPAAAPGLGRVETVGLETAETGEPAAAPATAATTETPGAAPRAEGRWLSATVRSGDNLSAIFARLNLPRRDLYRILELGEPTASLKRLHPGQTLRFHLVEGTLDELVHEQTVMRSLHVSLEESGYEARTLEVEPERRVTSTVGRIESSLFEGGQTAGLSDGQIMELAEIFGWDIDFVLDIRQGDRFSVIYEELYKAGEKIGNGDILAAEFINQGRSYRALRFETEDGAHAYYGEDGRSLRKAFLRTPVNFSRISSYFNLSRRHPVLNTIRAHRGVDYAAPTGTPIKATADGKVEFAGRKGGYGNTVVLAHSGAYTTLYAHLSRFARGLKPGQRVRQGQLIGYVGKSGLATGPHLHYEFRVNGVHKDPVRVELPNGTPISHENMPRFKAATTDWLVQLASLRPDSTVASAGGREGGPLEAGSPSVAR